MIVHDDAEMMALGKRLATVLPNHVIELVGDVGAGKTTLVRGLAEGLGAREAVTSPSFTISKTYALPEGRLIHYDFYRLGDPGLMVDDLAENLADPAAVVAVEWGESVAEVLPLKHMRVEIYYNDDDTREVKIYNGEKELEV